MNQEINKQGESKEDSSSRDQFKKYVLLGSVFLISICGLVYELLAGTISSYLVGSAVTQFSFVIGGFLFSMGAGALLSRYIENHLLDQFVRIELALGLVGGLSAFLLLVSFTFLEYYLPVLYLLTFIIGALIGMEIPIVIRLLKEQIELKVNVSAVLGLDYIGALIASLAFPLFVLPYLGQVATSFLFGFMNVGVAFLCCLALGKEIRYRTSLLVSSTVVGGLLIAGFLSSGFLVSWLEGALYKDTVIYSKHSPYQKIVLTRWRDDVRLYLDGNLQFSTVDEHRYHESLVHSIMGMPGRRKRILILGGGDGLAAREVLKYDSVKEVDVVDLDSTVTGLFSRRPLLTQINSNSLNDPSVSIINRDAFKYLENRTEMQDKKPYDRIILDFPDPNNHSIARLYTAEFYRLLVKNLSGNGYFVTQATSPFMGKTSFWCINNTIGSIQSPVDRKNNLHTRPFHAYVPTFGDWGFVMASPRSISLERWNLSVDTKFLTDELFPTLFTFPRDMEPLKTQINHMNNHILIQYYERDWGKHNEE